MKCKNCKRVIPENSLYCPWCGSKQLKEKKKEIKVPEPVKLASGRWRIQLRKEGVSVTEDTYEKCKAKAIALRAGYVPVEKKKDAVTLGDLIDKYISDNDGVLSPSTIYNYKSYRKVGFQDIMPLDIHAIDWQVAISDEADEFSPKTVRNRWGLITKAMHAAGHHLPPVNLPQPNDSERPWLDFEQIQTFLKVIRGQDCELPALLALHSLRRSEFLALTPEDIDLKKGIIKVDGARVFSTGGMVTKDTNKNATSKRQVPIMIPRLTELLQTAKPGPDGRLITAGPCVSYAHINKLCEQAGLPLVGNHGLRHSFCSLCFHLHWRKETTQNVGGWKTSVIVDKVYKHLAMQDKNEDIERMKEFYQNS